MPASRRIKGKSLTLTIDGVDYACDSRSIVLQNEEADDDAVTFCEIGQGGSRRWYFTIELLQSLQQNSFWRYVWEHSGEDVAFVFAPEGGEEPTSDSPHFVGTLTIGPKPSIGGEAAAGGQTFTSEVEFDVVGEPELDEGV